MDRFQEQIKHYDKLSQQGSESSMGRIGSDSVKKSLSTPYKYCEDFVKNLSNKQDLELLDFGCGTGSHSIAMALQGAKVTGIDISQLTLNKGYHLASQLSLNHRINFVRGNCEQMPFKDHSFDIIYCSGSMFCFDLDKAYKELNRVVRPGGLIVLLDTLGHNPLLNLNRWIKLKMGKKIEWSVKHIMKMSDIEKAKKYFDIQHIYFFDFFSVFVAPFEGIFGKFMLPFIYLVQLLDKLFFSIPFTHKMAFKFVCILKKRV